MNTPCVYIVGAGPGDPSLISVRGLRCLESADVIVYDHRVHVRLLRLARADAEKIDVGRAAPQPMEQDAISYLLAEKAR
ncbi:MAG TPA: SAM-dependent methyltransferase, partial [Egibacteraceae bacterium]|nr:SAM-dependent methyltransferase [Egibacteraceae bacterium]